MLSTVLLLAFQGFFNSLSEFFTQLRSTSTSLPAIPMSPSSVAASPGPVPVSQSNGGSNLRTPVSLPPTLAPAPFAVVPKTCSIPRLVGDWEPFTAYPMALAEAQGTILGDDHLVIISGFTGVYQQSVNQNYGIRLRDPNPTWKKLADFPNPEGVTHGAFAVVGELLYLCGGYVGGHPGPHTAECFIYDHQLDTWSTFESLPEGRAGGGMVYSSEAHALLMTAGAERPNPRKPDSVDYQHTWMYYFDRPADGWVEKADIPYLTNHMSYATSVDATGKEHHHLLAGQIGENQHTGNVDDNFEWDVATEAWIRRKSLPFTRGHASSSTTPVNCGFLLAGGSSNEFGLLADVSFYDGPTDQWTSLGELPDPVNTPVCNVLADESGTGGWYYCVTGWVRFTYAYRIRIEL